MGWASGEFGQWGGRQVRHEFGLWGGRQVSLGCGVGVR